MSELVLSPTRTYAPVIKGILKAVKNPVRHIHGIIHCTGGGQTKCLKFVPPQGVRIEKNELFKMPTVFKVIQDSAKMTFREMLSTYNMGHRMEIYCKSEVVNDIFPVIESFGMEAKVIGRCVPIDGPSELTIKEPDSGVTVIHEWKYGEA